MEAVLIFLFTISKCFFEEQHSSDIDDFLKKQYFDMQLLSLDFGWENCEEAVVQLGRQPIHGFLFSLDQNPTAIIHFIKQLQRIPKYAHHPMILCSQNPQDLVASFFSLKPFCPVLFPLTDKGKEDILDYLQFYYELYQKNVEQILEFDFPSASYRFPIKNILFAEACNRKVTLYTTDSAATELPISFHEFLENLPENSLIQTHRSFVINPKNVSKVDKHHDNFTVIFFGTQKTALISRSYKKEVMDITCSQLRKNAIQMQQQSIDKD